MWEPVSFLSPMWDKFVPGLGVVGGTGKGWKVVTAGACGAFRATRLRQCIQLYTWKSWAQVINTSRPPAAF